MPPTSKKPNRDPLVWTFPVAAEDVSSEGKHFDLTAPPEALAQLAQLANARALSNVTASFDLERRAVGLRVRGRVTADIEQTCVVTLEPLHNRIDEAIDVTFAADAPDDDDEVSVSADAEVRDPPEPLQNGQVDLAAVASEFLLLGVDPYPRKEGVAFETAVAGNPDIEPAPHPFAALAALKKPSGEQNS